MGLTMDAVAQEAGVARTTVYRRYRDKADLVSAAIETLRAPVRRSASGDARADLIAHLDSVRRNYGVSLAGTLLMEDPYNPRLLELFRDRMVRPQRRIVAETVREGISVGRSVPTSNSSACSTSSSARSSRRCLRRAGQGLIGPSRSSTRCGRRWPPGAGRSTRQRPAAQPTIAPGSGLPRSSSHRGRGGSSEARHHGCQAVR